MIIDHGRVLFDGHLDDLKQKLLRTKQIKFALKDREQAACLELLRAKEWRSTQWTSLLTASASTG